RSRSSPPPGIQLRAGSVPGAAAARCQLRAPLDDLAGRLLRLFTPPAAGSVRVIPSPAVRWGRVGPVRASAPLQERTARPVLVDVVLVADSAAVPLRRPSVSENADTGKPYRVRVLLLLPRVPWPVGGGSCAVRPGYAGGEEETAARPLAQAVGRD